MRKPFIALNNPSIKFPNSLTGKWNFVTDFEYIRKRKKDEIAPDGVILIWMDNLHTSSYELNSYDGSVKWVVPIIAVPGYKPKPIFFNNVTENAICLWAPYRRKDRILDLPRFQGRNLTPNLIFNGNNFIFQEERRTRKIFISLKYEGKINFKTNKVELKKTIISQHYKGGSGIRIEVFSRFDGLFNPNNISFEVSCASSSQYNINENKLLKTTFTFIKPYKMYFWLVDQDVFENVKNQLARKEEAKP